MRALWPAWPPGRVALDHRRVQPFGRAVDRGRQTGRTGADDDQVVQGRLGAGAQPERVGDLARRPAPRSTVPSGSSTSGSSASVPPNSAEQPPRLGVALELEPLVGHVVAGEEHPRVVAALRPAVADDPDAVEAVGVARAPTASSRSSRTGNSRSSGGAHGFIR